MLEAINRVLTLQNASGAIRKSEIMREFQNDENFRIFLYYALNPRLTYKISEQTLRKPVKYKPETTPTMTDIFEVCEMLSSRKALDDATTYQVCAFVQSQNDVEKEFYTKLLAKTLRLGVTAKSVNKVMPGLIPEWEVQQAYPIDKYPVKNGTEFWLTQKLNGVRATLYKGKLYARSGVPFEGLDHILDQFKWDKNDTYVFDGELTLRNKGELSDNEAFRVATGIINSDATTKTEISYTVFDVLPTEEFEHGESRLLYSGRRAVLDVMKKKFSDDGVVSVLPVLYNGSSTEKIDQFLEKMVAEDKEGLMLNLDVPYKCKRHNGILKVKRFYTMDLPILRCEEGVGKFEGTLGSIVVDYDGSEVGVGGFTDEQRAWFWQNRETVVGSIIEVKYKDDSYNKVTGKKSLQFPTFVSLRTDKEEISYG